MEGVCNMVQGVLGCVCVCVDIKIDNHYNGVFLVLLWGLIAMEEITSINQQFSK